MVYYHRCNTTYSCFVNKSTKNKENMDKNVSLAIEKAVGSISQKNQNELKNNGPKKPDLFSLSGETELFQNERE